MSIRRQKNSYLYLCKTIHKGNKLLAENLILKNAIINIPEKRDNTPLHRAIIKFNDLDIMKMLLDRGANIHAKDYYDDRPLDLAIRENKTEAASLLIEKGALIGENLHLLLDKAIHKNNHAIVKMIIDHGIQDNSSINLFTTLQTAIFKRSSIMIEAIIPHCGFSKPFDLYIPRDLIIKSDLQSIECVKLLVKWNFTIHLDSHHDGEFVYGAIKNGYLQIVEQLLERGIDVNMVNSKTGLNLLTIACLKKHHQVVEKLLQHHANTNVKIIDNNMILNSDRSLWALRKSLLLVSNKNNTSNITCLHISVFNADSKTTKLLLKYGGEIIDSQELFEVTCIAVLNNDEDIVRILLDHGANVKEIDFQKATILYECLNSNLHQQHSRYQCLVYNFHEKDSRYNIAKLLLEKGADIHLQIPGNNFVFKAITEKNYNMAQLFLNYNADVQYIGSDGDTLLHVAIKQELDIQFIETLLKLNSPVNTFNSARFTPLLVACNTKSNNQLKVIEVLLHYNADLNYTNGPLMTPVHYACNIQNLELLTFLFNKGANPNVINRQGQTPLHTVCNKKSDTTLDIIKLLLKHGANIEAMDSTGRTPLFKACEAENYAVIKCLLDKRANVNHIDGMNLTPVFFVLKNLDYYFPVIKILLKHNVNVNNTDMKGNSIIHFIVEKNDIELVDSFISTDVNFNSVNYDGDTPLHMTVDKTSYEKIEMAKKLIKYGSDINILNINKQTPLQKAITNYNDRWRIWRDEITITILATQVVKLTAAGLKVINENFDILYNCDYGILNMKKCLYRNYILDDMRQLEVDCKLEIKKMKTERVGIDKITVHDLLKKNIRFFIRFVENKEFQKMLEQNIWDEKFPLYIDIIRNRFREMKIRYKIENTAKRYFQKRISEQLPNECIDIIFDYLSTDELNRFVRSYEIIAKKRKIHKTIKCLVSPP